MIITKPKMWLQRPFSNSRIIGIVGMHRSGTSFLTGSLQQAGLELHQFHRENPFNKKGNRENQQVVDLNERILMDNGGSWDAPPSRVVWSTKHLAQAQQIIAQYANYPVWGFKDPRTLINFAGWKQLLPALELVGIIRHPMVVAKSLQARDQSMSIESGLNLWHHYNRALLTLYEAKSFPILNFNQDFEHLQDQLRRACHKLRLSPVGEIDFYDAELIHQDESEGEKLPSEIAILYRRLLGYTF